MKIEVRFDRETIQWPSATLVTVHFKRARVRGLDAEPKAGECTWLDRTVSAQEPSNLLLGFVQSGPSFVLTNPSATGTQISAISFPNGGDLVRVFDDIFRGRLFTVKAFNAGQSLQARGGLGL
jgi:hypothetical protein